MIEGISLSFVTLVIGTLGVPGLMAVLLYAHIQHVNKILAVYREDVQKISRFYEDNVQLVKNYERTATDLRDVITLNTQVMTQLVEKISNNMYCPAVREKGPIR